MFDCISHWRLWLWSKQKLNEIKHDERRSRKVWAKVVSVYDGDTFTVVYIQDHKLFKRRCRCAGFDSPEIRTKNSQEKEAAQNAKNFLIELLPKKPFRLNIIGLDKYGRFLVDLHLKNGKSLKQVMIDAGHGYEYDGGTKKKFDDPQLSFP